MSSASDSPTSVPEGHMGNRVDGHSVNKWLVLVVVCFAQFMVVLDATIVNVALPSIQTDLDLSPQNLQWIVNAYTLVFGGFLLLGGRAADLLGRKKLFIAGTVIFSAASLVNALATSGEMLIIARGFQGLGGALTSPAALSIITTTFDEGPDRTKALSVWGGIAAGGAAFGLLLGGILTDTLDWRWNFIINVPIGLGVIFAALRFVPESRHESAQRHFDVGGAVTVTAGLMVLVYAIVKAQDWGWTSLETIGWFAGAIALLGSFVAIELRSPQPLVRLSFFNKRWITIANLTMFVVAGGMFGMFYFASLYVQQILGYDPLQAGAAFLPVSFGIMLGAVISQQLIGRFGVKAVVMPGMALASIGLIILASTTKVDGTYLALLAGLAPMAVGMGMTFVPLTLVATAGVDPQEGGLASGLFNTSQQVGGALGLAILATVAANTTGDVQTPAAMVDGFQAAFVVASGLMLAGLLLVTFGLRKREISQIHIGETVPVPA
ncbi:MAG: MFS transporter [Thermoleophilaceae bacterium]|nr:MFS transporter [Thermoleophilaceae bacterium]